MPGGGVIVPSSPTVTLTGFSPYNATSLEQWRRIINYHPYHFWQQANTLIPITSACNTIVRGHSYQSAQFVGRDTIREAIQRAEETLQPWLGYYPAPHYREVTLPFPKFPKADVQRLGYAGADDRWISINLPEGYIQAMGLETLTLIQANVPLVYTDENGDGIIDTFSLTVVTTALDAELAIYFNAVDRFTQEDPSEKWRIKPISIRPNGVAKIISGPSWIIAKPILSEGFATSEIDPDDAVSYPSSVDVYRRWTDDSGTTETTCEAVLIWETPPYPQVNYNISFQTTDPSGHAWAPARCQIRDGINGVIGLGESIYNSTTSTWESVLWWASLYKFRTPDRVTFRYLAGYPLDKSGETSHEYAAAVARLAAAELPSGVCACDRANAEIYRWQFDLARTAGGGDESYGMISREDLGNPFGTRRGQVEAWKFVKARRTLTGYVP